MRMLVIDIAQLYPLIVTLVSYAIILDAAHTEMVKKNETKKEEKVCYKDLGCYSMEYPWNTTGIYKNYLPEDPDDMDTKFYIKSRMRKYREELIVENNEIINNVNFMKPIVLIAHGWQSSISPLWVYHLEDAFLYWEDANVISVDWRKGASGSYYQARANMRVIAAQISRLLETIVMKHRNGNMRRIHLVGHSLGAHLVSYIRINGEKLPYITGLDPAQPLFEGYSTEVKLDETDADFVVVIHTYTKPLVNLAWVSYSMGTQEPSGHVDFYLNGGLFQPGCAKNEKGDFIVNQADWYAPSCSHNRAQEYLTESLLSNCLFWAIKWNITESYPLRNQTVCNLNNCQEMGKLTEVLPARGTFYVKTRDHYPYCDNYFIITRDILEYVKRKGFTII